MLLLPVSILVTEIQTLPLDAAWRWRGPTVRLDAVCVLRFSPDMACACVHGICATKSVCDNITPGCSAEHASRVFPYTRNVAEAPTASTARVSSHGAGG